MPDDVRVGEKEVRELKKVEKYQELNTEIGRFRGGARNFPTGG